MGRFLLGLSTRAKKEFNQGEIMDRYHLERMTLCEKDDADCPDELWHVPLYKVVTQAGRVVENLLTHSQGLLAIDDLEFNDWVDEEDLAWD